MIKKDINLNYLLELVREKYADPITIVIDENTENYMKKLKVRDEKIFKDSELINRNHLMLPFVGLEKFIENMKEVIVNYLPQNIAGFIINNIAIGGINNKKVNAISCHLDNNKYVIVMNYGLMIFLNKALKYIIGALNPKKNIIYCNRCEPNKLTSVALIEFLHELSLNYIDYGEPLGAKIILDVPATNEQIIHLFNIELFILCHELGHILNGDFESNLKTRDLLTTPLIKILSFNSRKIEYNADKKGYELFIYILNKFNKNFLLSSLISIVILFNFLSMIMDKESSTHPFSIDRSLQIAKSFYGDGMFLFLKSTYKNPKIMIEKKEIFAKLNVLPNKLFENDSIKTTLKL